MKNERKKSRTAVRYKVVEVVEVVVVVVDKLGLEYILGAGDDC